MTCRNGYIANGTVFRSPIPEAEADPVGHEQTPNPVRRHRGAGSVPGCRLPGRNGPRTASRSPGEPADAVPVEGALRGRRPAGIPSSASVRGVSPTRGAALPGGTRTLPAAA